MSTNELRSGRNPNRLVWPDDREIHAGEDKCAHIVMVDVPGSAGMTPWAKASFDDGSVVMVNALHLAMIIFED